MAGDDPRLVPAGDEPGGELVGEALAAAADLGPVDRVDDRHPQSSTVR